MACRRRGAAPCEPIRAHHALGLLVERVPGYAPDLNPVELCVRGNVKGANSPPSAPTISEVERELRAGLRRVRRSPTLAFAFLRHAGLSI